MLHSVADFHERKTNRREQKLASLKSQRRGILAKGRENPSSELQGEDESAEIISSLLFPQTNKGGEMWVMMPIVDGKDHAEKLALPPIGSWTNVEISQTLDPGSKKDFINRIKVGNTVSFSRPNPKPAEFEDVLLMFSNQAHETADNTLIRHFKIQGVGFEGE